MNSKILLLSYKIIYLVVPFLLQSGLLPRSTGTDAAILLDAAADVSLALAFLPKKECFSGSSEHCSCSARWSCFWRRI